MDPSLKINKQVIAGNDFPEKIDEIKNILIVGSGGSGKSMFMKRLFLRLCENPFGKIPIFVELRDLNTRPDRNLLKLVHHQWSELIPSLKPEALDFGFRAGRFSLLLDGLDEVDKSIRDEISKQILEINYKFSLCPVVVTSRPIGELASWPNFFVSEIQPFDLTRIVDLITKTSIEESVKTKFLDEVRSKLIKTHGAFLANPLLCTMMMLTFTEFEEIPSKMHIFYARAFDVLFTRHDKTKTFFNRKFYTTLAEDDFKRLFSTFCMFSYLEGKYSFDREAALRFIVLAIEFQGAPVRPEDFLADLDESVSILIREGDTYSFLHRSFQEYFSAIFLAERELPQMDQLFDRILDDHRGDSVLQLLFEINRDALESKFLIQKVHKFRREIVKFDPKRHLPQLLNLIINEVDVPEKGRLSWNYGRGFNLLKLLSACYKMQCSISDLTFVMINDWEAIMGIQSKVPVTKNPIRRHMKNTLSISNARLMKSSFSKKLMQVRADVIELDNGFRRRRKSRDSFVNKLLQKA